MGRPGLRNASLQVSATESGGQAQLNLAAGALEFPGVFDEPVVPFDTLAAQLAWKIEPGAAGAPPRVSVQVKDGRFANPDAQGELGGSWSTGAGEGFAKGGRLPGQIELNGRITRGDAAKIARYLPCAHGADAPVPRPCAARAAPCRRRASASRATCGTSPSSPRSRPRTASSASPAA